MKKESHNEKNNGHNDTYFDNFWNWITCNCNHLNYRRKTGG